MLSAQVLERDAGVCLVWRLTVAPADEKDVCVAPVPGLALDACKRT
jgi:hypothetical protein